MSSTADAVLVYRLGNSGLKISKIILGAMSYGNPKWEGWVLNEKDSLPLLEHAYKSGINTWDTVSFPIQHLENDVLMEFDRPTCIPMVIASVSLGRH